MKKIFSTIFLSFLALIMTFATHNRAGEITYKLISGFTYEITITTFTYELSPADRPQLEANWGDNNTSIVPRTSQVILPNFYKHNTYKAQHTYPGPGSYEIVVQDPNRNFGVVNIPNSVNVVFSIKTNLVINPLVGFNSTPVLLNPPIDRAALGHRFIHNPAAYDAEGDSISYKLTVCTEEDGRPIEGYTLPPASDTLYINAVTGDLVWDAPESTGIYNIAILIEEWRNGAKISSVARDMQIDVYETDNNPPEIPLLEDLCVVAGDTIDFEIFTTDPDNDEVTQSASGGPFIQEINPANFETIESDSGFIRSRFRWITDCSHVRDQPFNIVIKATDDNSHISLTDQKVFNIRVIGPPPQNPETTALNGAIRVNWEPHECSNVTGYEIYRKEGSSGFVPDSCETGIPSSLGFTRIGSINGHSNTSYLDDNNGRGLNQGIVYCYRIVAIFPDGAKSIASEEICANLIAGLPALTQVSVTRIDAVSGEIFLSWIKPQGLDTIPANGPYKYLIYRSTNLTGEDMQLIDSMATADLADTTYLDAPLNTLNFPYSYKVELYNDAPGDRWLIGTPEIASSHYLDIDGSDNELYMQTRRFVPWINTDYTFFRENKLTMAFDSIGTSTDGNFTDTNLANNVEQCYRTIAYGYRNIYNTIYPTVNYSHKHCGMPIDTIPPCPPDLFVRSSCDSLLNFLSWTNPNNICADDVVQYNIYYSPLLNGELALTGSTYSATDTTFTHFPQNTLAGCYTVTAVDSFENESPNSLKVCVDECLFYELPNVFTPDGDNINDTYRARNLNGFVKQVDMQIFNRWGQLVYKTNDPYINWDGRHMDTKNILPTGVYYYICDVYEPRLTGIEIRNLVGFIHLYTKKGATIHIE